MVTSRVSDMTDTFVYGTWPTMISTHRKISQTTPLRTGSVESGQLLRNLKFHRCVLHFLLRLKPERKKFPKEQEVFCLLWVAPPVPPRKSYKILWLPFSSLKYRP